MKTIEAPDVVTGDYMKTPYLLRGDSLDIKGAVASFARRLSGIHGRGRAVLDMQGIRHYLRARFWINLQGAEPFELPL